MSKQTLYRFWNGDTLLYVGISVNAFERASQHRLTKEWWQEADRVTFEHFPSREAVELAETRAIRAEHPKYNIAKTLPERPTTNDGHEREQRRSPLARLGLVEAARYSGWNEGPVKEAMKSGALRVFPPIGRQRWNTTEAWVDEWLQKLADGEAAA